MCNGKGKSRSSSVFAALGLFLLIGLFALPLAQAETQGSWISIGGPGFGAGVTATPLPNGDVILIGGSTTSPPLITVFHSEAVAGNTFNVLNPAGDIDGSRNFHSATLLKDGQILIAGGLGSDLFNFQVKGELYDPIANTFAPVGSMNQPRQSHSATLLSDGTVLIAGGVIPNTVGYSNAAEIYDPLTRQFISVASMARGRAGHTATLLPNGKVLIVGGDIGGANGMNSTAELYDPSSRQFTFSGSTFFPNRSGHSATLLRNGKVLIVGGYQSNTAELYDPSIGSLGGFVGTGPLSVVHYFHAAALLSDGRVLIAGGNNFSTQAELYDPDRGQFTSAGFTNFTHQQPAFALLPNGKVVVFGSFLPAAGSELYSPPQTWTFCANENGTCSFSGTKLVRYGAGNSFAYQTATNSISCNNATFGDPIYGSVKHCDYTDAAPPPTWTFCANENQTCSFTGTKLVRYGAGNSFAYQTATNNISCNNATFGDPIFGTVKHCDYSDASPPPTWTFCADENGTCSFAGTKLVRYGAGTSFVTQIATNSISCTNTTFGDPIVGTVKHCDYTDPSQ